MNCHVQKEKRRFSSTLPYTVNPPKLKILNFKGIVSRGFSWAMQMILTDRTWVPDIPLEFFFNSCFHTAF